MIEKDNLFILIGPTAIGKTALSINLAKKLNGEIISADSMQIYKLMNIGTAKITIDEMDEIPHHLIDIVYPDEEFTVADYKRNSIDKIIDINERGRLPIIAGGTGLYINSLVYNLNFTEVEPNEEIRANLESLGEKYGNEYLHRKLSNIDKTSADKISPQDKKRIIRALEIFEITGIPMSDQNKNFREYNKDYNLTMVGLNMDRQKLYNRINLRVNEMLEEGLIEEVSSLIKMGYNKELVSMQGIGYKEIIEYLEGNSTLEEAIELLKRKTRNYAKRQITWFKRDERIKWYNVDEYSDLSLLTDDIINNAIKNNTDGE